MSVWLQLVATIGILIGGALVVITVLVFMVLGMDKFFGLLDRWIGERTVEKIMQTLFIIIMLVSLGGVGYGIFQWLGDNF